MKKFILIFLAIFILLVGLSFYSYNKTTIVSEEEQVQIVKIDRNIPIEKNKFYTITYEIDFSNNKVKRNDSYNSKEYYLSEERIEWLKVSMAHCFEVDSTEEDLKKSGKEYYSIIVDDTILLENRINRIKQFDDILEEEIVKEEKK